VTVYVKASDVSGEIFSRLSQITVANGFETDIGLRVMRGRRKIPADGELPCIQLIEGGDDVTDTAGRTNVSLVKVEQSYVIDAFDFCDPDNPNDQAHKMIRDVKRVIFKGDRTLGGKVSEVEYLGRDIGPRPDGSGSVQAQVALRVSYAEDLSNP
jgi:hypothetical protein